MKYKKNKNQIKQTPTEEEEEEEEEKEHGNSLRSVDSKVGFTMKIKRGYTIKEEDESLQESSDEPKVTAPKRINQSKVGKSHQTIDTDFGDGLFSNGEDL